MAIAATSESYLWSELLPPIGVTLLIHWAGPCGTSISSGVFMGERAICVDDSCNPNAKQYASDWKGGDRISHEGRLMNWRPVRWAIANPYRNKKRRQ